MGRKREYYGKKVNTMGRKREYYGEKGNMEDGELTSGRFRKIKN